MTFPAEGNRGAHLKNLADLLSFIIEHEEENGKESDELCVSCQTALAASDVYLRYRVCPKCGFHYSLGARERITLLADKGTFQEMDSHQVSTDPIAFSGESASPYTRDVSQAQKRTGLSEAVVTGTCRIGGARAVVCVLDFGFMGGSMGCVVGEKMARAFERALLQRLPVVAVVASGGARMQEGVLSLMQMAKTVAVANRMHKRGLPFLVVLSNPSTGQVYASFANLGDILIAEPGALIGFAPLRVMHEATGRPLPSGAHTAEAHLERGMVDMVVERPRLQEVVSTLLDLLGTRASLTVKDARAQASPARTEEDSAWTRVQLARHKQRPTSEDYIQYIFTKFIELHGDRLYGDDPAIICGLGYLQGKPVVVVGHERGHGPDGVSQRRGGRPYPEGFRKAQRALRLAAKFRLPVVSLVDTPGAYQGLEAEERGMGGAIATTMALMTDLPAPVVVAIIGEGGSEGALALSVADRILMLENAILAPVSPEGAAGLLYRDTGKADVAASYLRLTAQDCKKLGIVDAIVREPAGGAHQQPDEAAKALQRALVRALADLQGKSTLVLRSARYRKFRNMGEYSSYFQEAMNREIQALRTFLAHRLVTLRAQIRESQQAAQTARASRAKARAKQATS
ncbi:MAG: acetyl-CoA carboxylase carboxyltransferase subunit alpha/beta [Dehalococcoidia bacterium]|nr:acetyl-CoA carboxylase carboxyltransferase subunit alpha/beta [Dehalococcoidia bacterium]